MIKNIVVSLVTHPELYSRDLDLGLEVTGDMVAFDDERNTIYRIPFLNNQQIRFITKGGSIYQSIYPEGSGSIYGAIYTGSRDFGWLPDVKVGPTKCPHS